MDYPVPVIPLLVIVLLEVVVGRVDAKHSHHIRQFNLLVSLIQQSVIFFIDHAVTVTAVTGKHLEASPD